MADCYLTCVYFVVEDRGGVIIRIFQLSRTGYTLVWKERLVHESPEMKCADA
jgi:hypothetical protein